MPQLKLFSNQLTIVFDLQDIATTDIYLLKFFTFFKDQVLDTNRT